MTLLNHQVFINSYVGNFVCFFTFIQRTVNDAKKIKTMMILDILRKYSVYSTSSLTFHQNEMGIVVVMFHWAIL